MVQEQGAAVRKGSESAVGGLGGQWLGGVGGLGDMDGAGSNAGKEQVPVL